MGRLIDADALKKQIEDFHCKDCDSYNFVRCRACWVDDTITYLEEAPTIGGWISVTDRLPEKSGDYIVYTKDGLVWPYFFQGDTWYDGLGYGTVTVTHWMPLPEPPEEDNNG